jgi:hypothetical protein
VLYSFSLLNCFLESLLPINQGFVVSVLCTVVILVMMITMLHYTCIGIVDTILFQWRRNDSRLCLLSSCSVWISFQVAQHQASETLNNWQSELKISTILNLNINVFSQFLRFLFTLFRVMPRVIRCYIEPLCVFWGTRCSFSSFSVFSVLSVLPSVCLLGCV